MAPKNPNKTPAAPTSAAALPPPPPPPSPVAEVAPVGTDSEAPPPPPPPPTAEGNEAPTPAAAPSAPSPTPAAGGFRGGRGGAMVSPEAIQKGIEAREQQSKFNAYVTTAGKESARTRKDRARLAEIDQILTVGTEIRPVANWIGVGTNRKRAGTADKPVKISPSKRLALMAEKTDVTNRIRIAEASPRVSAEMRAEFLKLLPAFASRKGYDRAMLLAAGVPEADLNAARIK